jgi:DNA-binding transcriptional LysR family regulator
VPKSTVSRALTRLETELQARLVERSTRKLSLTETGEALLVHAEAMLAEAENAVAEIAAQQGNPRGLLRVAMPATMARSIIAPELPRFVAAYPDVNLALTVTDRLLNPITDEYDIVIRAGWLEDSALIVRRVAAIETGLFASRAYVAAHGLPASPADLADHQVAGLSIGASAVLNLRRGNVRSEVPLSRRFTVNDPVVAAEMMRAGLMIAQCASWLVEADVAAGDVVPVLPGWDVDDPPSLYALYPSRTAVPPKVRVFLDFIDEVARAVLQGRAPHPEARPQQ